MRRTIIVNAFAGPGAGKTTAAWDIAANLKKRDIETEYVSEYAKELVWDGRADMLGGTIKNQALVYEEQKRRIDRLLGKVDVIVTDSPIILSAIYIKPELNEPEEYKKFQQKLVREFKKYDNFNFFINRDKKNYQQAGRIHNLEEAIQIDEDIKRFLDKNNIYYGTYYHSHMKLIADNIERHLKKV